MTRPTVYKLVFFVPEQYKERVKQAAFDHGAGRYQNYESCAWETSGSGQFKPLPGSQPFIGEHDVVEHVDEYRVEMLCDEHVIKAVLEAIIAAHPYETPAYEVWPVNSLEDFVS